MGKPTRLLVDPDNPQSIVQQQEEITRVVDGQVSFGNPSNPSDIDDVTLAGSTAAAHPGTLENIEGSWAQQIVSATNTPVMFYHNLGVPVTQVASSNQPNVRVIQFMWVHPGIETTPSLTAPANTSWKLIRRHEVTGAAATTFAFTGLDGDTDKVWKITYDLIKAGVATFFTELRPNGDAAANYFRQRHWATGAAPGAANGAANGFAIGVAFLGAVGHRLTSDSIVFAKSGNHRMCQSKFTANQANMWAETAHSHWTNTAANITSLTVANTLGTAEFGVGTVIEIWAPQDTTALSEDATISYWYDTADLALITENAFPLRFAVGGNRLLTPLANNLVASLFFIPAVR